MKIREWHTQLGWWVSGIFATGATWYFLSSKNYCVATISAILAGAFALMTVLLHKLRDGQGAPTLISSSEESFVYQPQGRFGKNILSGHTHEVTAGQSVSMQAHVPKEARLHVVLEGLPAVFLEDGNAGWSFSIAAVTNWDHGLYHATSNGGEQHFDAEPGNADMKITFSRAGKFTVRCFERGAADPASNRTINVNAA